MLLAIVLAIALGQGGDATAVTELVGGYCVHNPQVVEAARTFRAKRPEFEAELQSIPGLDPKGAASAIAFMAQFFAEIATDQDVDAKMLKRCVG